MGLIDLVARKSALAISMIKQLTNQPIVGEIPIAAYRFEESISNEVSKKVLIDLTGGKRNVQDNVAVGPKIWIIEGYVGGLPGEYSSLFMPSLPVAKFLLENLSTSRQPTTLIDKTLYQHTVMIEYFWCADVPDTANRLPVKMTLVELTVLQASFTTPAQSTQVEGVAGPTEGSEKGPPVSAGTTENVEATWAPPEMIE